MSEYPETKRIAFRTTHWSQILKADTEDPVKRRRNLETLCRQYWNPVYSYLRRIRGMDPTLAEDRTQEFFAYLIEHHLISRAKKEYARFRTYLKAVLRLFLASEGRRDGRQKRGGGRRFVSISSDATEQTAVLEVASSDPAPEEYLDREWARHVMQMAHEEMTRRLRAAGRDTELEIYLLYSEADSRHRPTYEVLARQFGKTDWEIWKCLSKSRRELQVILRNKVADTVRNPNDVEEEMTVLVDCLS